MDNVREIPHSNEVDRRPRKRPRISTEVRPHSSNVSSFFLLQSEFNCNS